MVTPALERAIYEWWKPELERKDWRLATVADTGNLLATWTVETSTGRHHYEVILKPLYINGRPNMNFWYYDCVPRLKAEGVFLSWNSKEKLWKLHALNEYGFWRILHEDSDPLIALGEYLGIKNS